MRGWLIKQTDLENGWMGLDQYTMVRIVPGKNEGHPFLRDLMSSELLPEEKWVV